MKNGKNQENIKKKSQITLDKSLKRIYIINVVSTLPLRVLIRKTRRNQSGAFRKKRNDTLSRY